MIFACIPNLIDEVVPFGKSDEDNQEVKSWGKNVSSILSH